MTNYVYVGLYCFRCCGYCRRAKGRTRSMGPDRLHPVRKLRQDNSFRQTRSRNKVKGWNFRSGNSQRAPVVVSGDGLVVVVMVAFLSQDKEHSSVFNITIIIIITTPEIVSVINSRKVLLHFYIIT